MTPSARLPASDICIVGGAGHVGLPLALVLAEQGMHVRILDLNEQALAKIRNGQLPFQEHGAQPLLEKVLDEGLLSFTSDPTDIAGVPSVILTIGTPVDEFLNPETNVIKKWADDSLAHLTDDQLLVLRSTIYPGTTDWLHRYLCAKGRRIKLAYCPERIAQGFAIDELRKLPQLVSGTTVEAEESAVRLFERIAPEVVRLTPLEAEFAKLFTNSYRYIVFAIVNQFFMLAEQEGLDFDRILHGCRHNYPRMASMPGAGFAAGPCLFKDTMQLAAFSNNKFVLGHSAMLVNEGLPAFLVKQVKQERDLSKLTVGILGMAFKAEIDDPRTSLSYKLKKLLELEAASVLCTDPYVNDKSLVPVERVLEEADVIFVATPHKVYRSLQIPAATRVVDVWNCVPSVEEQQLQSRAA